MTKVKHWTKENIILQCKQRLRIKPPFFQTLAGPFFRSGDCRWDTRSGFQVPVQADRNVGLGVGVQLQRRGHHQGRALRWTTGGGFHSLFELRSSILIKIKGLKRKKLITKKKYFYEVWRLANVMN
jgi:hypothetical protein